MFGEGTQAGGVISSPRMLCRTYFPVQTYLGGGIVYRNKGPVLPFILENPPWSMAADDRKLARPLDVLG